MVRSKRRHKTAFGYIGSGNNTNVFNRKPRMVFSEIKDKLNTVSHKEYNKKFTSKELSIYERKKIKEKIKDYERQKLIKAIFFFTILIILILIFSNLIITKYL